MKTLSKLLGSLALALLIPQCQATVLIYHFAGALSDPFGIYPAGTPFAGTFSYDTNQPDLTPDRDRGDYFGLGMTLDIGDDHVAYEDPGTINIYDNSFYPTDLFHFYTPEIQGNVGGLPLYVVSLVLQDVNGQALANASLPQAPLQLSQFSGNGASFLELQSLQGGGTMPPNSMSIARGDFTLLSTNPLPEEIFISHFDMTLSGDGG